MSISFPVSRLLMSRLPKGFLTYSSILHSHALHGIQKNNLLLLLPSKQKTSYRSQCDTDYNRRFRICCDVCIIACFENCASPILMILFSQYIGFKQKSLHFAALFVFVYSIIKLPCHVFKRAYKANRRKQRENCKQYSNNGYKYSSITTNQFPYHIKNVSVHKSTRCNSEGNSTTKSHCF